MNNRYSDLDIRLENHRKEQARVPMEETIAYALLAVSILCLTAWLIMIIEGK